MATRFNLREFNKKNIYDLIYESDGISTRDISYNLQLSLQTVSQNLAELKNQNLIREDGTFSSTGGRKAKIIRVAEDAAFAVGMDITKNHVALVIIDLKCTVLKSVRLRLGFADTPSYYKGLGKILETFLSESGVERKKILGVGVSLPAIVSKEGKGVSYITVLSEPDDLYAKLSEAIPFPFLFFNDANSGGFAEARFRRSVQKMVYLSLSNSVGGAVMYTQDPYTGDNQRSGEFGHMTLHEGGRLCYCGKRGCADAYCNAKLLSDVTGGDLNSFFLGVEKRERVCVAAFRRYLKDLAILVNNLRMCFDCDIVLGGYVGSHMSGYIGTFTSMVNARNPFERDGKYVQCCGFKLEASAVGAALYYVDDFVRNIR